MKQQQRWFVTGATGQLGGHVIARLRSTCPEGAAVCAVSRDGNSHAQIDEVASGIDTVCADLADPDAAARALTTFSPSHVLHIGAMTAVADAYANPELARVINVDATVALARAAAGCGARFVFTSTDMVFDGEKAPYDEDDPVCPLSVYGATKAEAEERLMAIPGTVAVRLPLMYGLPVVPRETTFTSQLRTLCSGESLRLFDDEFRTMVWLRDAADALIAVAQSEATGIIHVAGPERLSRYDLIARCAGFLKVRKPKLESISRCSIEAAEPRPGDLSLDGSRFAAVFPDAAPGVVRSAVFDDARVSARRS